MANVDNADRPDQKTGQNPQSQSQKQNPQTGTQSATQSATQGSGLEAKGPSNVQGSSSRSSGQGDYSFRCSDAGHKECNWQTQGSSPDEVMRNVEQHGRQQHNLTNLDDVTRNKVRSNIRSAA